MPNLTPYEAEKLKEFDKLIGSLWDRFGEEYEVYDPDGFANEIKSLYLTSLRQARQNEREVMKKEVRQFREIIKEKLLRKARKLDYADTTEYEEAFNIIDREIKKLLSNKETKV